VQIILVLRKAWATGGVDTCIIGLLTGSFCDSNFEGETSAGGMGGHLSLYYSFFTPFFAKDRVDLGQPPLTLTYFMLYLNYLSHFLA
jgi:hypothetical protein